MGAIRSAQEATAYEMRFRSLFHEGRAFASSGAWPCRHRLADDRRNNSSMRARSSVAMSMPAVTRFR
jgi:hypothetical protein